MDYSCLTQREFIGFNWERSCQGILKRHNARFRGNPTVPKEWKKNVAKGPDIFLELGILPNVDIECKFTNHKIQPSYILRDYLPRFEDTPSEHRKIILTNDVSKFGDEPRRMFEENGLELWDTKIKELSNIVDIPTNFYSITIQHIIHQVLQYTVVTF